MPSESLYRLPLYYDIAFSWDPAHEVAVISDCLAPLRDARDADGLRLLEPGCGTGRLLTAMAMHGHALVGYDKSEAMVAFARRRIEATGLADRVRVAVGEMIGPPDLGEGFDAAFCPINSLAHLVDDAAIISHLQHTAAALRAGGLYSVQLAAMWEPALGHAPAHWTISRDGLSVEICWTIESEDPDARLSHQRCRMTIDDAGRRIEHDQPLTMRLWTDADWRRLVGASGVFELAGVRDDAGAPLDIAAPVTADAGNAWWVLRKPTQVEP